MSYKEMEMAVKLINATPAQNVWHTDSLKRAWPFGAQERNQVFSQQITVVEDRHRWTQIQW